VSNDKTVGKGKAGVPGQGGAGDQELESGEKALDARKARDAALLLPFAGLILISPPLLAIFTPDVSVFGGPLVAFYLFTVWAVLIVCAFRLARRLKGEREP
jgi:hypothetical protein